MILLYFSIAIITFGILISVLLIKKQNKEGKDIKNIESGLIIAPTLSFGFLISFLFNPLINWFDFLQEYQMIAFVIMPISYGYCCYLADKNNYSKINKIIIDIIFTTFMVLSLPYGTYFIKNIILLPLWLDNLLIVPFIVFIINSLKKENKFDGFSSMFITVMGLGICALMLALKKDVNIGVTYLAIVVSFTSLIFFVFNCYPSRIFMTNSGASPLILSFLWVCLQFSFAGKDLMIFCLLSYIIIERIISLIKELLNKIPLIKKICFDSQPYYIIANKKGQAKDKILTYIMKWHMLIIMIAFASASSKNFNMQSLLLAALASYWISYNLSKYGEEDPSLKEITSGITGELKNAFFDFKKMIKDKNKNDKK